MKRALIAGLIVCFGVASGVLAAQKGNVAAGKTTYTKQCATCHAAAGEGNKAIGKMLKVELRALGSKEVQGKSDAELRKVILEGVGKMKPVKGLTDKDIPNVIAYVRSLVKK